MMSYIIINVSDITDTMIEKSIQTSRDTLLKTKDGQKAILRWKGETPECFEGINTYNYKEIKEKIKEDWS
jgi:hypothetical protein